MRILFFTSSVEDYLGDALLHGFRKKYGSDCIDYPKCEIMYKGCPQNVISQVRGNGFTLYTGLLEDIEIDRFNIEHKLRTNYYDLIIISDIQRQYGWFVHFRPWLSKKNTIILDGMDTPKPFPARGLWWRKPVFWMLPKAHKKFLYFKREWTPDTHFKIWMHSAPAWMKAIFPHAENLRTTAFSIPEEKIIKSVSKKTKTFPKHIVDPEVAKNILASDTSYVFDNEEDYFADLQVSRFGITTQRAGWDCLRHYEIAANGAVICFRNLNRKPPTCAPHGLEDGFNCISYTNYENLMSKIEKLSVDDYEKLQTNAISWALANSTEQRVNEILEEHRKCQLQKG